MRVCLDVPGGVNLFLQVEWFAEERSPQYVPPEADDWKVAEVSEGQDKVMLLAYLHTGARKSALLGLIWDGVDFQSTGSGSRLGRPPALMVG